MKKIFSNLERGLLERKFYHKVDIGSCTINILPRLNDKPLDQSRPGQEPDSYEVTTDLKMKLSMFGSADAGLYLDGLGA